MRTARTSTIRSLTDRPLGLVAVLMLGTLALGTWPIAEESHAQEGGRLNPAIAALEAGEVAVANQHWRFIDMEHSPFSGERLQTILAEMDLDRDANGRMNLAPLVRIPQDGDEDFRWAVKQVLDLGGMGVILPHVDTKDEAVRLVRAMRYPPTRDSPFQEPRGERGWGPSGAIPIWRAANAREYHSKADVWPLNPDGELFAVAIIESGEAVGNIYEILEAPLSAIMVVPGDMSIDLGLGPPGADIYPEVEAAFQTVLRACQAQSRVICGCGDSTTRIPRRLDEGWRFVLPLGG